MLKSLKKNNQEKVNNKTISMKTNKKRENNDVMLKLKVLRDRLSGFDLLFRRRQQVVHKEKETRKKKREQNPMKRVPYNIDCNQIQSNARHKTR